MTTTRQPEIIDQLIISLEDECGVTADLQKKKKELENKLESIKERLAKVIAELFMERCFPKKTEALNILLRHLEVSDYTSAEEQLSSIENEHEIHQEEDDEFLPSSSLFRLKEFCLDDMYSELRNIFESLFHIENEKLIVEEDTDLPDISALEGHKLHKEYKSIRDIIDPLMAMQKLIKRHYEIGDNFSKVSCFIKRMDGSKVGILLPGILSSNFHKPSLFSTLFSTSSKEKNKDKILYSIIKDFQSSGDCTIEVVDGDETYYTKIEFASSQSQAILEKLQNRLNDKPLSPKAQVEKPLLSFLDISLS